MLSSKLLYWFYYDLAGLGGWALFTLAVFAAVIYIWYDSLNRDLNVWGWRIGVVVLSVFLLPAIIFRFTVPKLVLQTFLGCIQVNAGLTDPVTQCVNMLLPPALTPYYELIFYVGMFVGGILPIAVGIAYYYNFQDYVPQAGGRPYFPPPPPPPDQRSRKQQVPPPPPPRPTPRKTALNAWLIASDGRNYQLYEGETTVGRSSNNDIYLSGDTTVSKQHAKITEQNGHFRLIDLGSRNGTRVNGRWVRQPILLEPDDEIRFGDHTVMRFVTARR